MKLRNIIIAISALVAFTACSKDDPDGPDKQVKANTFLSAKVNAMATGNSIQGEDPLELEGEAFMENLTVFIFDQQGEKLTTTVYYPNVSGDYELPRIEVGENIGDIQLLVIANAPISFISKAASLEALQVLLAELANQEQDHLTMSSGVIKAKLSVGDNYIGVQGQTNLNGINTLWLTRIAARLELSKISTRFTKEVLLGRGVTIDEISFDNVKTKSLFYSEADWGEVWVKNNFSYVPLVSPEEKIYNDAPYESLYRMYAMENLNKADEEKPTSVLVKATLEKGNGHLEETVNFRAAINSNGLETKRANHNFVKRNYVYFITLTFTDSSFEGGEKEPVKPDPEPEPEPGPDPTLPQPIVKDGYLDLQVEVVQWGPVTQNEEF